MFFFFKCTGNYKAQNWPCFRHKINNIDLNLPAYSLFRGLITFIPHNLSQISPSIQKHWEMTHLENGIVARMADLTILCGGSLQDFKCRQREPYERPYGSRKQMPDQQVLRMPIQDDRHRDGCEHRAAYQLHRLSSVWWNTPDLSRSQAFEAAQLTLGQEEEAPTGFRQLGWVVEIIFRFQLLYFGLGEIVQFLKYLGCKYKNLSSTPPSARHYKARHGKTHLQVWRVPDGRQKTGGFLKSQGHQPVSNKE